MAALAVGVFIIVRLAPGGPAAVLLGPDYWTAEREAELNQRLGLDEPLPFQVVLGTAAVARGELGFSYFHRRPVVDVVLERVGPTMVLGTLAWIVSTTAGAAIGTLAGFRRGAAARALITLSLVGVSIPAFWLGIVLIVVFAAWMRLLPSAGLGEGAADQARHIVLPMLTLAIPHAATLALYTRTAIGEVLAADHVRTARAKGLRERIIAVRHVLRNASIPISTMAGLQLVHLLEGSVVVESVFAWPGIGHLTLTSVTQRDYPVLLAISLLVGAIVLVSSFMTDVVQRRLDPRLGYA
jgi:peptide/nickel transport system permease protein